jgi:hypothetical protein
MTYPGCPGVGIVSGGQLLLAASGQSSDVEFKFESYGDPASYQPYMVPWEHPKAPVFYNGTVWGQGQMRLNINACGGTAGTIYTLQTTAQGQWSSVMIFGLRMLATPVSGAGVPLNVIFGPDQSHKVGFSNPNTVSRDQVNRIFGDVVIEGCGSTYIN